MPSHRPIRFQKSYLPHAEGSCLVTMGKTQVLCVATVLDEVPPHAQEKGMGWVTAEYAMLPRAGECRSPRSKTSSGGRVLEISRLVGRSLRSAVRLEDLGLRTIVLDCDVLRADGGTRTASVNGALIALVQALKGLQKKGLFNRWPLKNFVGALSIGLVNGEPVVDMSYADDKNAETDLNVVLNDAGEFIEVQATAEGKPFSNKQLDQMLKLASASIKQIIQLQKKTLGPLPR